MLRRQQSASAMASLLGCFSSGGLCCHFAFSLARIVGSTLTLTGGEKLVDEGDDAMYSVRTDIDGNELLPLFNRNRTIRLSRSCFLIL